MTLGSIVMFESVLLDRAIRIATNVALVSALVVTIGLVVRRARMRKQWSLRLVLVVVCCLGGLVALGGSFLKKAHNLANARAAVESAGGQFVDLQFQDEYEVYFQDGDLNDAKLLAIAPYLSSFGSVDVFAIGSQVTEEGMKRFRSVVPNGQVFLREVKVK